MAASGMYTSRQLWWTVGVVGAEEPEAVGIGRVHPKECRAPAEPVRRPRPQMVCVGWCAPQAERKGISHLSPVRHAILTNELRIHEYANRPGAWGYSGHPTKRKCFFLAMGEVVCKNPSLACPLQVSLPRIRDAVRDRRTAAESSRAVILRNRIDAAFTPTRLTNPRSACGIEPFAFAGTARTGSSKANRTHAVCTRFRRGPCGMPKLQISECEDVQPAPE
jgi:hypothetical protein